MKNVKETLSEVKKKALLSMFLFNKEIVDRFKGKK